MNHEKNVFLLLIRLDWTSPALLGVPTVTDRPPFMEEGDEPRHSMLVGVLDPFWEEKGYITPGLLKSVLSALLAVVLWFLVLLGVVGLLWLGVAWALGSAA